MYGQSAGRLDLLLIITETHIFHMSQKQRHTTCWGFDTHGVNPDSLTESDVDDKLGTRKSTQDMKRASGRIRAVSDAGLRIKKLQVRIQLGLKQGLIVKNMEKYHTK